jgi:hypothetical protein
MMNDCLGLISSCLAAARTDVDTRDDVIAADGKLG